MGFLQLQEPALAQTECRMLTAHATDQQNTWTSKLDGLKLTPRFPASAKSRSCLSQDSFEFNTRLWNQFLRIAQPYFLPFADAWPYFIVHVARRPPSLWRSVPVAKNSGFDSGRQPLFAKAIRHLSRGKGCRDDGLKMVLAAASPCFPSAS